jgi:hypothetical protein
MNNKQTLPWEDDVMTDFTEAEMDRMYHDELIAQQVQRVHDLHQEEPLLFSIEGNKPIQITLNQPKAAQPKAVPTQTVPAPKAAPAAVPLSLPCPKCKSTVPVYGKQSGPHWSLYCAAGHYIKNASPQEKALTQELDPKQKALAALAKLSPDELEAVLNMLEGHVQKAHDLPFKENDIGKRYITKLIKEIGGTK